MSDSGDAEETCAVCGNVATGGRRFAHLYHKGKAFPLCCPLCLDVFQRAPERIANGERPRTVIEELMDELKWRNG